MPDIFELSDHAVEALADANPLMATAMGVAGRDHRWPDLSPEGHAARRDLAAELLDRARDIAADTPSAHLAKRVLIDDLEREILQYDSGDHRRDVNNIASAFQGIKAAFDLMPKSTKDEWGRIAVRLETIDAPLRGYRSTLDEGLRTGDAVARRQVLAVIEEGRLAAADTSPLHDLVGFYDDADIGDDDLRTRLMAGVDTARAAYGALTDWLEETYLPQARESDGVGADRYALEARKHLGKDIDIGDTYAWGWTQIDRLWNRLTEVCAQIDGDLTVHEVVESLSTDPRHAAPDRTEFLARMRRTQEEALAKLAGTHFDVPPEVETIEVKASPPGGALAPYYTPPSEDFSRPGTVWYPLGDRTSFPLWGEITTAYHEGFPGHHLQVGVQTTLADQLSRYHRTVVWQPGSGEGWALYAETLMLELGYLDEPAHEVGYLAAQLLRSCRIVIDIGVHCGLPIPDDVSFHPGEEWTFETAVEMMQSVALQATDMAESEVTRYFGWPGQAISYLIGQRTILELRDQLRQSPDFDLKEFHTKVLSVGSIGLDLLQELVLAA